MNILFVYSNKECHLIGMSPFMYESDVIRNSIIEWPRVLFHSIPSRIIEHTTLIAAAVQKQKRVTIFQPCTHERACHSARTRGIHPNSQALHSYIHIGGMWNGGHTLLPPVNKSEHIPITLVDICAAAARLDSCAEQRCVPSVPQWTNKPQNRYTILCKRWWWCVRALTR